ncbi:YtxH domain-containing protein [Pedobacter ginsengisoli]|uniref:YtxH domain-containing protein n=1 Tax=Pedobacter ginsengisoli TaxID=363852 RepID=UPI00254BE559|nr:YtxH domain-containing protein [Pedobacter ginsengisoli]
MKISNNTPLTAAALVAGLAIGAALGILLAPKSGRDNKDVLLTDHSVEDLWETTRNHADHLQGLKNKRKNTSSIEVPSAGTLAWTEQQKNESKQPWKENNHAEWRF